MSFQDSHFKSFPFQVGSQTTMELLKSLAIKNNFHYHKDRTQKVETIKLSNSEQVRNRQTKPKNFNGDKTKKPAKNRNRPNFLIFLELQI